MDYYDVVLGTIPVLLVGVSTVLILLGLEPIFAVPFAAGLSMVVIGHAVFINAPVDSDSNTDSAIEPTTD